MQQPDSPALSAPPVQRIEDYELRYKRTDGSTLAGVFRIAALEHEQRFDIHRIKVNVAQVPLDHLDAYGQAEVEALAHVLVQVKSAPEWYPMATPADVAKFDPEFTLRLGRLCGEHTRSFRSGHGGAGGGSAGRPEIEVRRVAEALGR